MIGQLPTALEVNGCSYAINSDYRIALLIFTAYDDPELSNEERHMTCLRCLYTDFDMIPRDDYTEALKQAFWYLDGGDISKRTINAKIIDWTQDDKIIFPAVNRVAGFEVRAVRYLHWWTFLGYFAETGEGLLSTVVSIRTKKAKGKALDKYEQEIYRDHKDMIEIKQKLTADDERELEFVKNLI